MNNLDSARLALLVAPTGAIWSAQVSGYNTDTFVLTFSSASGALPANIENLTLVRAGADLVRVRSTTGSTLTLAENPVEFEVGDTVALYAARLPWPRYQKIVGGEVFKDFDLAFPATWQAELPPTPVVVGRTAATNDWQEAVYCQTSETISLDAAGSFGNLDTAPPLAYAWDAGVGGTITGTGATVTVSFTSNGFRYIALTVTDAHGSEATRYLPVWVGDILRVSSVTRCSGRWDTGNGWTVDLEIAETATILQYSPAAVVDVETQEVVFFGFIVPNSQTVTFERTTTTLTLQSALTFSRYLHAYPFLVTEVTGATVPTEWAELYEPTLARALWFLLHWHSTLPEVVNVDLGNAPLRSIAGQEFTLGSLPQQMDAILKSAFWHARGNRAGGFTVAPNPLYLAAAPWAALTAIDLSAGANLREQIGLSFAEPTINQVRLGGVFQDTGGTFEPALAQAPAAPGPWGSPSEVNNLAPVDAAELEAWAGRHIAVENTADEYSIQPGLPVDPAVYRVADLPASVRIAIERVNLTFDPQGLRWQHTLSGRAYGRAVSAVAVPVPPPVEFPTPELPPFDPPLWPPFPEDEALWPTRVWIARLNYGVYYADDFPDPDQGSTQPTWTLDNDGLPNISYSRYTIRGFGYDVLDAEKQLVVVRDSDPSPATLTIYTREDAGTWASSLTEAQATALASKGYDLGLLDVVYDQLGGTIWAIYKKKDEVAGDAKYIHFLKSVDNGANWSYEFTYQPGTYCYTLHLAVRGLEMAIAGGVYVSGSGRIAYSANGGASWGINADTLGTSNHQGYLTLGERLYVNYLRFTDDLVSVNKSTMALTNLLAAYDLAPESIDAIWEDPENELIGRLLRDSKIWQTVDGWASLVDSSPSVLSPTMNRIWMLHPDLPDAIFLATETLTSGSPHALYIKDGVSGTLLPRGGSVSYLAGPIVERGIAAEIIR